MRRKNTRVQCEFHPILTAFLFIVDEYYKSLGSEAILTSGSEIDKQHSYTSLHYATPCQAVDIRSWTVLHGEDTHTALVQHKAITSLAIAFCIDRNMPADWLEIILENNHIHIEYQPKRQEGV